MSSCFDQTAAWSALDARLTCSALISRRLKADAYKQCKCHHAMKQQGRGPCMTHQAPVDDLHVSLCTQC